MRNAKRYCQFHLITDIYLLNIYIVINIITYGHKNRTRDIIKN